MAVVYIQSIGGASGDMLLGALVDSGFPPEILRKELRKLNVDGYDLDHLSGMMVTRFLPQPLWN